MGMTINVEIVDEKLASQNMDKVFSYFQYIDDKFSTYKDTSEISSINKGELKEIDYSADMKEIFRLSLETKKLTNRYFDIRRPDGFIDPSGMVKGWAIYKAAQILKEAGVDDFFIDAGGDIQTSGRPADSGPAGRWKIGIRNPFKPETEIIEIVNLSGEGLATSGIYARGDHIYNPITQSFIKSDIVSLSIIGPNVYEADRFATAAFAMGRQGIDFIESLSDLEGYMIDRKGMATMTSNFAKYLH